MGYLIRWDNEQKTVVFQQYTGKPIKDDLYHLAEESAQMLKSVSHPVHLIIDERTIKLTLSSSDIKFLEKNVPPNQGAVVMVVSKSDLNYKKVVQNMGKKARIGEASYISGGSRRRLKHRASATDVARAA